MLPQFNTKRILVFNPNPIVIFDLVFICLMMYFDWLFTPNSLMFSLFPFSLQRPQSVCVVFHLDYIAILDSGSGILFLHPYSG